MIISLTNASITNQRSFVDQNRFLPDIEDRKEHFFNSPKMYFYKKIKQINQIKENIFSIYNLEKDVGENGICLIYLIP